VEKRRRRGAGAQNVRPNLEIPTLKII